MTVTFADVEGGLRDWLKTVPAVTTHVGTRAYFSIPTGATFPFLVVSRVGGGPQTGEAPLDDALMQIDVWGRNKAEAAQAAAGVVSALQSMSPFTPLGASLAGLGASVESLIWLPDPEGADTQARYVVTATVTVMAT